MSVFVAPGWLEPLLRGWAPPRPLSRVWYTRFFSLRLQVSHSPQASYLILHKYEPEDSFAVSGLVLVSPPVTRAHDRLDMSGGSKTDFTDPHLNIQSLPTICPSCSDTPLPITYHPFTISRTTLAPVSQGTPNSLCSVSQGGSLAPVLLPSKHGDIVRTSAYSDARPQVTIC